MDIKNIKGKTHYIKGGTNTGVFIYNNSVVMVDPGLIGRRPNNIIKKFEALGLSINYIIITHEHNDHYGACSAFKSHYKDLKILSSKEAKLYIEDPSLFSRYIVGGKSNKFFDDILNERVCEQIKVDDFIDEGNIDLDDNKFEIFSLPGHTLGSIGVLTEDRVIFVGDHLIGEEILQRYDFLFIYDIKEYKLSLERLKNIDYNYLVTGHGSKIINKENSLKLINKHEQAIEKYINQVLDILIVPIKLESILKILIQNNNLRYDYKKYHFFKSSLISLISYLIEFNKVGYDLQHGELLYYSKIK